MTALPLAALISIGDAASQLAGRLIPVRVDGQWRAFTDDSNESVSGAASRWSRRGRFEWVEYTIDVVLSPRQRNHCREARIKDTQRAITFLTGLGYAVTRSRAKGSRE